MKQLALLIAVLTAARLSNAAPPGSMLADSAAAILRNDYRGDRARLLSLAHDLERAPAGPHEKYRRYWIAFAYWRRGFNGLNEAPKPADLADDFEQCATHARAALALDEGFEDARGALLGCLMGRLWVPGAIPEERKAGVLREGADVMSTLMRNAGSNPRSLWLVGMQQAYRPAGGDPSVAIATWKRGLAGAREEALSAAQRAPWVPSWGAPEILMNLANFHTYTRPDKAVARAYAEGALAMAPDWHYVRDILLAAIERLPDTLPAQPAGHTAPSEPMPAEKP
ncbi:MAG: hypothetical protein IT186_15855 [Acidobacteria bacterium]|nr:hypothetical protein [Acidobacteriota bacterium]MCG3194912.1 hypothetical protein [Thermoanaerobaculia bacterium]